MKTHNLIVGIDPGTTVGVSVLDLQTGKTTFWSKRNVGINSILAEILKLGFIVAIGSDKKPAPIKVIRASSMLGAKLFVPKENPLEEEKVKLSAKFQYKNPHERDAISAMMIAYTRLKPLLKKIDFFLEEHSELNFEEKIDLQRIVISGKIIKEAFEIIKSANKKEKRCKDKSAENRTPTNKTKCTDFNLIKKSFEKQISILKNENFKLKKRTKKLAEKYRNLKLTLDKINLKSSEKLVEELFLENKMLKSELQSERRTHEAFLQLLNRVFLENKDFLVVPKLKNFENKNELEKIESKFSQVAVENPNEIHADLYKTDEFEVIFFNTPPKSRVRKAFNSYFIPLEKIKILFETDKFILIKKEDLKILKKPKLDFEKILQEYKKNRKVLK